MAVMVRFAGVVIDFNSSEPNFTGSECCVEKLRDNSRTNCNEIVTPAFSMLKCEKLKKTEILTRSEKAGTFIVEDDTKN